MRVILRYTQLMLLCLLFLASCLGYRIHERDTDWLATTRSRFEEFILFSPYDEEVTSRWAFFLRLEFARGKELFSVATVRDLEVRMIPAEAKRGNAAAYHWNGTRGSQAVSVIGIYVPDVPMRSGPVQDMSSFRHELGHFFMHAADLGKPLWLNEGIAETIEHRDIGIGGVDLSIRTKRLLSDESNLPTPGSVARLASWQSEEVTELILQEEFSSEDSARLTRFHHHAHSFVLFLLMRDENEELIERLRAIASLTPDQLDQLEPEWIAWWAAQIDG